MSMSGRAADGGADPVRAGKADNESAVEALLERYDELKVGMEKIDPFFVYKEGQRPDIVHDAYDVEIPIIDLSPAFRLARLRTDDGSRSHIEGNVEEEIAACESEVATVLRDIRAACEEYGFFQIINHGFPMNVIEDFTELSRQLLELPLESKLKAAEKHFPGKLPRGGYAAMKRNSPAAINKYGHIWNEGFDFEHPEVYYPGTLEWMGNTLWPEVPEESANSGKSQLFTSMTDHFGNESAKLVSILLDLMISSLGLPAESVESLVNLPSTTPPYLRIRVNHFPVCPQPEMTWGIHGHTDPSIITWVYQDSVGGLQCCFKDGSWHGIRPVRGALIVNVGDYMQAWTNGRFISAEHRVVANEKKSRYSIANFVLGNLFIVTPRSELVDADHPLLYRPFSRQEYMGILAKQGLSSDRKGILEHFRIHT